jgi:hypothetical protein
MYLFAHGTQKILKFICSKEILCKFAGLIKSESSSVGRARPCQGRGREFESRLSLFFFVLFFVARMMELSRQNRNFQFRILSRIHETVTKLKILTVSGVDMHRATKFFKIIARMMELVDMQDLKSCGLKSRGGSTPPPGTKNSIPPFNL